MAVIVIVIVCTCATVQIVPPFPATHAIHMACDPLVAVLTLSVTLPVTLSLTLPVTLRAHRVSSSAHAIHLVNGLRLRRCNSPVVMHRAAGTPN